MLNVYMHPNPSLASDLSPSGITTVLSKYAKYAPDFDIHFLSSDREYEAEIVAVHAGMGSAPHEGIPFVSHLHGLYWTGDYQAAEWEYKANEFVIDSMRRADTITVPSEWVGETIRRDFRVRPQVLPHAIDLDDWQPQTEHGDYILWNKNRAGDVCSPIWVNLLARATPKQRYMTTFAADNPTPNIKVTGVLPHAEMKKLIQGASVYLATTKETFGIGILEAMASSVPVLAFREGGASLLVQHGITGYLADPNSTEDLYQGLRYCLEHRKELGENGREVAATYTWQEVMRKLHSIYTSTIEDYDPDPSVSVIIPCYNYADVLPRAVDSVLQQNYPAAEIIIVDDGSSDNSQVVARELSERHPTVRYIHQGNRGVAHARNTGIEASTSKYICCLDADDEIAPNFLNTCVSALESDRSIGVAYTRLFAVNPDGKGKVSDWPGSYDFTDFLKKKNQVPTCCVFQKRLWKRLGGYKQRYAPRGAGAEDAEFFLRMGAYGYRGHLASSHALFRYHLGGRVSGDKSYQEVDWLEWHPWTKDNRLPFAAVSVPKTHSNPVYQRDTPIVSVVIACGKDHTDLLPTALDSLEAQVHREWEAIVVCDGFSVPARLSDAYPYVKWIETVHVGAGGARNIGANTAQSPFLLFLDADDWLDPNALGTMIAITRETPGSIIYSDYVGHAFVEPSHARQLDTGGRLISFDESNGYARFRCISDEYDCELAQRQPLYNEGKFYIWSIIESLVPISAHYRIGGFDETMQSWEDWDYWIRMARAGICFTRVPNPLVHYRFYSGTRREIGRQQHKTLLEYLSSKYAKGDKMPCTGCGRPRIASAPAPSPAAMGIIDGKGNVRMASGDMVEVLLDDGNIGDHHIVGVVTKTSYGYHRSGDTFRIHTLDQQANPVSFKMVRQSVSNTKDAIMGGEAAPLPPPPPPRKPMTPEEVLEKVRVRRQESGELPSEPLEIEGAQPDLGGVWGIGEKRKVVLEENDVEDIHELLKLTNEQLMEILSITEETANKILESARSKVA